MAHGAFTSFLNDLRSGLTEEELSDALCALVQQVNLTGKPGTLTLAVQIKPNGQASGQVTVTTKATAKAPEVDPVGTFYFVGDGGELSRRNPLQPELKGLRDISNE